MIRTFLIPVLAIAGILFAVVMVVKGSQPPPARPPVVQPARAPYDSFVAGSGLVEASTQNIAIGTPVQGLVVKVDAPVAANVSIGDPLFHIDDRELVAQLGVARASLAASQAELDRLRLGTRPELIPPAQALVQQSQSNLDDLKNQLEMWEQLSDPRAVSAEELSRRRFAVKTAEARLAQARADLAVLQAGTWSPDIVIAEAHVAQARAQVDAAQTEIDRRVVRAPVDGRVLQVNIRPGEFAPTGALATPLVLMGAVDPMHIRVDVDENDAWRVRQGAAAVAHVRGNPGISFELTFVRFEPYVVPKRSLTGESTERVDTRVLQVIYSFKPGDRPIYVGQQMDVFIKAPPLAATLPPAAPGVKK